VGKASGESVARKKKTVANVNGIGTSVEAV